MTVKEKLLARGLERPRRAIVIQTKDGDELTFNVPHTGLERAQWRRGRQAFVKDQSERPNAGWVAKGLMPTGGYPEEELGLVYDLSSLCTEGWSQEDVLELLRDNYDETISIGAKFSAALVEQVKALGAEDIDEKKEPLGSEVQSIGSTEPV